MPPGSRERADAQWQRIYRAVRAIPRGNVSTYGELAELAGIPSGHRVAARAMRHCPETLPWQRVVGKKDARRGQISIEDPEHAMLQRALLESEGVVFDANGFIPLAQFGWKPHTGAPAGAVRRESQRTPRPRTAQQARQTKKRRRRAPSPSAQRLP